MYESEKKKERERKKEKNIKQIFEHYYFKIL